MAIHYNAFISYRHHPDDIRVASEIHRSLERFHVPRAIRKRTGKIERLFRDKEELPITSNLSDDIDLALKNSDFLIVICSVHTKESMWVQREIKLFLETHDRDHVLTVLASGEPYDVIPEILLYEDTVDPVTGEVKRIEYEPLSCDWRMKLGRAKREELPRLAAALLGCGYDELRQRQKQYRTRRLIAATSAVAVASTCLAAYFLHTSITIARANEEIRLANIQIQENLEEALTNQSRHLATAARERLENGDRLTALSLAVAALPGEDNVRPYVPEAEEVLTDALGIYNTVNQLTAVGTVSPGLNVKIQRFWINDAETFLYILDNRSMLTIWDLQTLSKTGEYSYADSYYKELIVLPDDNVLFLGGEFGRSLYCISPEGEILWDRQDCADMTLQEDGIPVILASTSMTESSLLRLDPETGEALGEAIFLPASESGATARSLLAENLPLGLPVPIRYYTFGAAEVYAVHWETGELIPLELGTDYPYCMKMRSDGKLYYLADAEGLGIGGLIGNDRVNTPETRPVRCFDLATGEVVWENSITASVMGEMNLEELPGNRLLCQMGNVFQVMDMETGEILSHCDAGSTIVKMAVGEQNATALLQDGYVCYYWFDANYTYEVKFAQNGVSLGQVGQGMYLQYDNADHVTVFRTAAAQPDWMLPVALETSVEAQIIREPYLAFMDYQYVYLMDLQKRELIWAGSHRNGELLGFSEDGTAFCYYTRNDLQDILVTVDIATGEGEAAALPVEDAFYYEGGSLLRNDQLYYVTAGYEDTKLVCLDRNTQQYRSFHIDLPEAARELKGSWHVLETGGGKVWAWGLGQVLAEVDLTTGESRILEMQTEQKSAAAVDPAEEWVALAWGKGISLQKIGGEEELRLDLEGACAGSLCFREGELLALCNNGVVFRFGMDGRLLSRTALTVGYDFAGRLIEEDADPRSVLWQFTPEGKLVVNLRGQGSVIDCETWGVTASVSDFVVWDAGSDTLVCNLMDCLAGFSLYSTEELLAMAQQELGSFTLTGEQKAAYGID